ncbi:MAG TPA: flagellar biosynthetic protein FliR [Polyangiaceae bacterium]|nr:flagellar biosynthetic protein FliR [Polyangiaceae bacterium]
MTALTRTIVGSAALFALVASRIVGFVVVSPFPGQNVSRTQRASLVMALAWVATSFAAGEGSLGELDLTLAGRAVVELGCGLLVGVAFRMVFAAAEVLGGLLGQGTGLSTPSVLNPTMEAPESVIARIVGLCGMLVALATGVHRVALGGLLESFRALPVGSVASLDAPVLRLADVGIDAFVVGVRLATPVVAVGLLVQLALALVSRAAPSLQIFSVGLGLLFVSGIVSLMSCLDDLAVGLAAHFATLGSTIGDVVAAVRR